MNRIPNNSMTTKNRYYRVNEQGVVLIVVLLFLILIMLAGVMAVRQSSTDLKTATADQINTLLLQSADGANIKIENVVNGSSNDQAYGDATADNGIFGHFFNPLAKNDELIYCYNPRQLQAMTNNTRIIQGTGVLAGHTTGNCNPTQSSSYISGRNTVLTQVSIRIAPSSTNGGAFNSIPEGRDINNNITSGNANLLSVYNFDIRSTSALPSYNDPGDCFTHSSASNAIGNSTLSNCLANKNVPKKQIYSQAALEYSSGKIRCVPFGIGTGSYGNTKCVLKTS